MKAVAFAILLLVPGMTPAAALTTTEETRQACAVAAEKFASKEIDAAFDGLSAHWPLPKEEITALAYKTRSQLDMVAQRFGAVIAAEHLDSDAIGTSLIKHLYLIKFEKHAVRFAGLFYKPHDEWKVNSVTWDDSISALFGG